MFTPSSLCVQWTSFKSCYIKSLIYLVTTMHLGLVWVGTATWRARKFWTKAEKRARTSVCKSVAWSQRLLLREMSRDMQVSAGGQWGAGRGISLGSIMRLVAWTSCFCPINSVWAASRWREREGHGVRMSSSAPSQLWTWTHLWTFLNLFKLWFPHKCSIS